MGDAARSICYRKVHPRARRGAPGRSRVFGEIPQGPLTDRGRKLAPSAIEELRIHYEVTARAERTGLMAKGWKRHFDDPIELQGSDASPDARRSWRADDVRADRRTKGATPHRSARVRPKSTVTMRLCGNRAEVRPPLEDAMTQSILNRPGILRLVNL